MSDGRSDTAAARFAVNMRRRRELRGWSQRQLAQELVDLGHSTFRQQTVAEIEAGLRQVKLDEALALSRALGLSVENLIRPEGVSARAGELLAAAWEIQDANRHARDLSSTDWSTAFTFPYRRYTIHRETGTYSSLLRP